jgi:protein-tyrosine phosphatase
VSIGVCFVCLGNICRSPTAEATFAALVERAGAQGEFRIDSAGTAAYHVGERADRRSRAAGRKRGYELTSRARQFEADDFARFEHVVAMDRSNYDALARLAIASQALERLSMMRAWDNGVGGAPAGTPDVPDPYYGGADGFELVLDICERASAGLLAALSPAPR